MNQSRTDKEQRAFESEFVDSHKATDSGYRYKSWLVTQTYGDNQAFSIAIEAPGVQGLTKRLILSSAAPIEDVNPHTLGITQACIQSATSFKLVVYIRPPKDMYISSITALVVFKTLYKISESGLHLYLVYVDHHVKMSSIVQS